MHRVQSVRGRVGDKGCSSLVPVRCKPHDPVMPFRYNRKQLAAADELLQVLGDDFLCGMMVGSPQKLLRLPPLVKQRWGELFKTDQCVNP